MPGTEMRSRIEYIVHKGRRILHIDHTALDELPDIERAREFFAQARRQIDAQPLGSLRMLTSMSPRLRFNTELTALEREFVRANTPYVKKSAVVGTTPAMRAIIATLRFFSGREIRTFETRESALDWLAE